MNQNYNEEFCRLASEAKYAQQNGDFIRLAQSHKMMADILHAEGKFEDEVKSRVLAFYFDLSGISQRIYIDGMNTEALALAAGNGGIGEDQVQRIYFDAIRKDTAPSHPMTVIGSYRLLRLCLRNQWKKANRIVEKLREMPGFVD